eukprot:3033434-Rhodomonas_salina.1
MDCICVQWEFAFKEGNCLKAWEVTGIQQFTQQVMWELQAAEERKRETASEMQEHLNWEGFDPKQIFYGGRTQQQILEEEIGEELDQEEAAKVLNSSITHFNSSCLFNLEGGVTGPRAVALIRQ